MRALLKSAYDWVGKTFSLQDVEPWKGVIGGGTYAGKTVNEVTAMQTSAVWTCVRILAESIGCLPLHVYRRQSDGNAERVDHPVEEVLVGSPNAEMTTVEYREAKVVNLALAGNGYSLIDRTGSRLSSLHPIESHRVRPERAASGGIQYAVTDRGKVEIYPAEKVWHWKGFGSTGLVGYSPIGYMRQAVGLALVAEEFGARFFSQGASPAGFLKIPQFLNKEQRQAVRESLAQKIEGLGNSHKYVLLEGGIEHSGSATMPLEDAEFMLLRGFQVVEICRIYRMPPHLAGEMEHATFSNIEHQFTEFVQLTLMPWLRRIEASADKYLFGPGERGKFFVRFNVDALLRGDSTARAQLLSVLLQNGVMSRNEARAKENMNRVEASGMDDYTVQSNMAVIDQLAELVAQRNGGGRI